MVPQGQKNKVSKRGLRKQEQKKKNKNKNKNKTLLSFLPPCCDYWRILDPPDLCSLPLLLPHIRRRYSSPTKYTYFIPSADNSQDPYSAPWTLAIKTDQRPTFKVDSPRLSRRLTTVLAATLPSPTLTNRILLSFCLWSEILFQPVHGPQHLISDNILWLVVHFSEINIAIPAFPG